MPEYVPDITTFVLGINGESDLEELTQLSEVTKHQSVATVNVFPIPEDIASYMRPSMPNKYSTANLFFVSYDEPTSIVHMAFGSSQRIGIGSRPDIWRKPKISPTTLTSMQDFYATVQEMCDVVGYSSLGFKPLQQPTR